MTTLDAQPDAPPEIDAAVRLDIGCGPHAQPGWVPIDRDFGTEAYPLPDYADDSVDEIRASHVLEHFSTAEVGKVLCEWVRVLKPGGRIRIAVPDLAWVARTYARTDGRLTTHERQQLMGYLMGGQTDENDHHHSVYDLPSLRALMRWAGLRGVRRWVSDREDCAALPVSLNLEGVKPPKVDVPPIAAVMSMPSLAHTANWWCASQTFTPRGIELTKVTGAYWGQCLERGIEDILETTNAEWIVTLDYDSIWTPDQFDELCFLLGSNPHIDAIAPWQVGREAKKLLVYKTAEDGSRIGKMSLAEVDQKQTLEVDSAHFGLTVIRRSALERMDHPWFWGRPNDEGRWRDHRVDDDIAFWQRFREAGNSVHIATHVGIGHLQQVITWPSDDLCNVVFQFMQDYQDHGHHPEARR